MIEFGNKDAQIAIIGRTDFEYGIASHTYSSCEMLARSFPVCFISSDSQLILEDFVTLPNGRRIPVCVDASKIAVSIFCDLPWLGAGDFNYLSAPANSLKYAWLVFDSDLLPTKWVDLYNNYFDLIIATSRHLVDVARASGVKTPIACTAVPLDLEGSIARARASRAPAKITFGSIASFHRRKGILTLLSAFAETFSDRDDVELSIHSNLVIGNTYDEALKFASTHKNITVRYDSLSNEEKTDLIDSFDVFVNISSGEGYSIGPREALALGKSLLLSAVGGHNDLRGIPGVEFVEPDVTIPARYLEIENGVFGTQSAVRKGPVSQALKSAFEYARSPQYEIEASNRKISARDFGFAEHAVPFACLINPALLNFKKRRTPKDFDLPKTFTERVEAHIGQRANRLSHTRNLVCAAYDGGFFSVFNAFMTHMVWQQKEDRCHRVLPDWDIDRFLERNRGAPLVSFCYGQPGDGNVWLKFFEPLYGATVDQMNDEAYLWENACEPEFRHNDRCEPLMTYVDAYRLYNKKDFKYWRKEYHKYLSQHIKLVPALQNEIDLFCARHSFNGKLVVAAHVRHPSHTIEQPDQAIANDEAYFAEIRRQLSTKNIEEESNDWLVFLATDQERVVRRFREKYGSRVCFYEDVRRTRDDEDEIFDKASADAKNKEGFQLQHLVAARPSDWSTRMGWEVVRDAFTMARCGMLLHVVSNVSTAVSYINPDVEMVFCRPATEDAKP